MALTLGLLLLSTWMITTDSPLENESAIANAAQVLETGNTCLGRGARAGV
jgi:hypothetical protein